MFWLAPIFQNICTIWNATNSCYLTELGRPIHVYSNTHNRAHFQFKSLKGTCWEKVIKSIDALDGMWPSLFCVQELMQFNCLGDCIVRSNFVIELFVKWCCIIREFTSHDFPTSCWLKIRMKKQEAYSKLWYLNSLPGKGIMLMVTIHLWC